MPLKQKPIWSFMDYYELQNKLHLAQQILTLLLNLNGNSQEKEKEIFLKLFR